ncbi:hypothetical protein V5G20_18030 [Brevibacillus borstelensis]|uniref:hypothetical protein n=1 Tax=Brevibacillus borstelensis TaxID=45462 RepID=UPI0030D552D1
MTQPKRTRGRTQKRGLSVEEFAYCDAQINEYDKALEDRFYRGRLSEGRYAFCEMKLTEWYDTLLVRGGVTE